MAAVNFGRKAGWAVLIHEDVPKIRPITPDRQATLEQALDNLAEIFADKCDWMLTGGLAIAFSLGKFYRDHGDFDIAIDKEDLPQLVKVAEHNGYGLFHRKSSMKISSTKRITFFRRIQPEEADQCSDNRIRLLRVGKSGWAFSPASLLTFLDIYPYVTRNGTVTSCGANVSVPVEQNRGAFYPTASGHKVSLRNLAYLKKIKENRVGDKSSFDMDFLKKESDLA